MLSLSKHDLSPKPESSLALRQAQEAQDDIES
jgi:hypothetical protein